MATEIYATQQTTGEIRTHFVDFTNDLPAAVTVTGASGTCTTYPASGTATVTIGIIASNVVPVTVASPTVAGIYYVDVVGTLSSGDKSVARLILPVSWASVRAGMVDLIQNLREMTDTGVNDYKVGGVSYWSDKHLQDKLDIHRTDFVEEALTSIQQVRNGTTYYQEYRSQYGNLETVASGTSVFKLDNAAGTNQPSSGWSADYQRGVVTFNADTLGSSMLLTGRSYDLNGAAADVWLAKAANASKMYNFSSDGQSFSRNQYYQACMQQASYYQGLAGPTIISLFRGDNLTEEIYA